MKKAALLVLLLGCVALLAWFAIRPDAGDDPSPEPVRPGTPAGRAAPDDSPAQRKRARAATASADATDGDAEPAPPPSPERPAETISETDSAGLLTVVGPDGGPVAVSAIAFLVWPKNPSDAPKRGDDEDLVTYIHRVGRILAAEPGGQVRIPKFDGAASVACRHAGIEGTTVLRVGAATWKLELHAPVEADVQVVDSAGKPCGGLFVAVVISSDDWSYVLQRSTTRGDGTARFEDLSEVSDDVGDGATAAFVPVLPLANPPRAEFDPAAGFTGAVRIVLPPTGSVECVVSDEAGNPAPDGTVVRLAATGEHRAAWADDEDDGAPRAETVAGRCRFPWVGEGLALEAAVVAKDATRVTVRSPVQSPAAGATAVVHLTLGPARPVVLARLVDAAGQPLAAAEICAEVLDAATLTDLFDRGDDTDATTGEDGRFRVVLDTPPGDVPGRKLRLSRYVARGSGRTAVEIGLVDLRTLTPGAPTDLGDIRVRSGKLVAAGVVTDPEGKPVPQAVVSAFEVSLDRWSRADGCAEVVAAEDGSFRIDGMIDEETVAIGVSLAGWFVDEPPVVPTGTTDARVRVSRAGSIAGSVKVPQGLDRSNVRVHVVGDGARIASNQTWYRKPELDAWLRDGDGFEFRSVRPGLARVDVRIGWGEDATVFSVGDVKVVAGETCRDPRLQDIDLSKGLRDLPVTVTDADGKPVRGARAAYRVTSGRDRSFDDVEIGADGVAHVRPKASAAGAIEFVVACRGYRSVTIPDLRGPATAVLRPAKATIVRVRLADDVTLPPAPFGIAVALTRRATRGRDDDDDDDDTPWGDPRNPPDDEKLFGKERVIPFEVFDPGEWVVSLTLWETEANGASGSGLATVPDPTIVTVGEGGGTVEATVRPDPEELRRETSRRDAGEGEGPPPR